jgi:SNF2 family DNA or RNA helicase
VSYDLARTEAIGRALAANTYDLVILDEGHYLKTIDSGRTRAVFGDHTGFCREEERDGAGTIVGYRNLFPALASRAGAVMALTGTPLPNRPREAYTLARNLCFDSIDWMSEKSFNERFNPVARLEGTRTRYDEQGRAILSIYQYTREEVGRAAELQARLRANFMVRHLKRDVMPQLKLPVYDIVHVEETKAVKQALAAESLLDIDPDTFDGSDDIQVLGHIAVVRHRMGLAIAPQVADYAAMCLDGGEDKLVVFAWHTDVLNFLQHRLSRFGVLRIDGSTSPGQRKTRVDEFIANPKMQIFLGQQMAAGIGTDGLQKVAAHVLLAEPDWVAGNNEQAVDRVDRGGQTRTVQADLFCAPNSLLQKILASAIRKRHNTHLALDERRAQ